jgi:D-aminopeptidase
VSWPLLFTVPFDGAPGPLNAITEASGVQVGSATLIRGEGVLKAGEELVRTEAIVLPPRGANDTDPVRASRVSLDGNGEMTGTNWGEESGLLEGAVAITHAHSEGTVRNAMIP